MRVNLWNCYEYVTVIMRKYINYVTEIGIYSEETTKHLFLAVVTIKCTLVSYTPWAWYIEFYTYELESEIAPMSGSL